MFTNPITTNNENFSIINQLYNQYGKQTLDNGTFPCNFSTDNTCGPIPLFGNIIVVLYFADSSSIKYTFDSNNYKVFLGGTKGADGTIRMQILDKPISPNPEVDWGIIVDYYPTKDYWKIDIAKGDMRIIIDNLTREGKYSLTGGDSARSAIKCSINFCTYSDNLDNLLGVESSNKNKCYVKYVCGQPVIVNGNCGKCKKSRRTSNLLGTGVSPRKLPYLLLPGTDSTGKTVWPGDYRTLCVGNAQRSGIYSCTIDELGRKYCNHIAYQDGCRPPEYDFVLNEDDCIDTGTIIGCTGYFVRPGTTAAIKTESTE